MKRVLTILLSAALTASMFAGREFDDVLQPKQLDEAQATSRKKAKPIALIITTTNPSCPYKEDWNDKVLRKLERETVMILIGGFTDIRTLPEATQKAIGNRIRNPSLLILSPDMDKIVTAIYYTQKSSELNDWLRDAKKEVRNLQKELRKRRREADD